MPQALKHAARQTTVIGDDENEKLVCVMLSVMLARSAVCTSVVSVLAETDSAMTYGELMFVYNCSLKKQFESFLVRTLRIR